MSGDNDDIRWVCCDDTGRYVRQPTREEAMKELGCALCIQNNKPICVCGCHRGTCRSLPVEERALISGEASE